MFNLSVLAVANADGSPNLSYDGGRLHSSRDPVKEGSRFATHALDGLSSDTALLVVGIGWGYHLPFLSESAGGRALYVFEPVSEVLDILEAKGRLSELRQLPGLRIIRDLGEIDRGGALRIEVIPQYTRLFPDLDERIKAGLAAGSRRRNSDNHSPSGAAVDEATTHRFYRRWCRNFYARLSGAESKALEYLVGWSHPAERVLYCGAGPGLFEDLSELRQPQAASVPGRLSSDTSLPIICADSALAPLLSLDLMPDLVLCIDSGPGTLYHLLAAEHVGRPRGLRPPFPFPVLTWTAGPTRLDRFFSRVMHYASNFPMDQVLAGGSRAIPEAWTNESRNLAGLALLVAQNMGASELLSAGADLRAHGGRSHARGTGYTEYALDKQGRLHGLEAYRPGGYGTELTLKNKAALEGMRMMAERLGVCLSPLSERPDAKRPQTNPDAATSPGVRRPLGRATSVADLRDALRASWSRINFTAMPLPDETRRLGERFLF